MAWLIGVNVGGTFTDFYALDEERGVAFVHKTPSTPDNPTQAILDGLDALSADKGLPLEDIGRLSHGTTVGTNALIQRIGGGHHHGIPRDRAVATIGAVRPAERVDFPRYLTRDRNPTTGERR